MRLVTRKINGHGMNQKHFAILYCPLVVLKEPWYQFIVSKKTTPLEKRSVMGSLVPRMAKSAMKDDFGWD